MDLNEIITSSLAQRWADQQAIPMLEMVFSFGVVFLLSFYVLFICLFIS